MYKATYFKTDGKKGRARALPDWLFDGVVNEGVLHQVVKAHLANQRQGTAAAKNRSAVRGGGRKPFRQKGTGRARQGTIRAGQMKGGGVIFPPIPHGWNQKVPKKVKGAPKTAILRDYLGTIEAKGKILFLTEGLKENVYLSARNLPDIEVRCFGEESVYDIIWATTVIIERGALENAEAPAGAEEKEATDA